MRARSHVPADIAAPMKTSAGRVGELQLLDRGARHLAEIGRLGRDRHLRAEARARQIEEIPDDALDALGAALDARADGAHILEALGLGNAELATETAVSGLRRS